MPNERLFMLLIGAEVSARHTEQHDVFFGIAEAWRDLVPEIKTFWPDARKLHVDAWREVTALQDYQVAVLPKDSPLLNGELPYKLFFLNLGGYRANEFDEFHYRLVCVAPDKETAIKMAKSTAFFKHNSLPGAGSHIDDKYGVDVDDAYPVEDILDDNTRNRFRLAITPATSAAVDPVSLGYFKFS